MAMITQRFAQLGSYPQEIYSLPEEQILCTTNFTIDHCFFHQHKIPLSRFIYCQTYIMNPIYVKLSLGTGNTEEQIQFLKESILVWHRVGGRGRQRD